MHVQIPIAGTTLTGGDTYSGQLPVWATRPLMIRVLPDFISGNGYPVYIQVVEGGSVKKLVTLPYQEVVYLDLSFAAPLLTRADRNGSEGVPAFPQQSVEIWSSSQSNKITLPVFHCDETYWYMLGIDEAFPQPVKPRIPGQTLDIYFPYRIHPLDAFQVEVEPVTGAPSNVIFPVTYILGNTIDITYIKKLTIKNVWGSGLDQVINYEDRLMSDVVYDESLQCALRARWNMRNGQWFWAAFKDYFWSNKFTPIRGRGGVTEQAEITINLEYGDEWYNVYQELLVSSNIVFDLDIPGINQYQSKQFRAEVSGDTGARWSNSTKTYRQQVRFRTTELQDNYMFPLAPDNPPTPAIAFSAQRNPWTVGAAYAEGLVNSIYSNTAWEVQSAPYWLYADSLTGNAGTSNFTATVAANAGEARTGNIVLKSLAGSTTYNVAVAQAGATDDISVDTPTLNVGYLTHPVTVDVTSLDSWSVSQRDTWITPDVLEGAPGETTVELTIADNDSSNDARTGTITFYNDQTENIAIVIVNQTGAPSSISLSPIRISGSKAGGETKAVAVGSANNWALVTAPNWITASPTSGGAELTYINITFTPNPGATRRGAARVRNTVTNEVAICLIVQAGISGNISTSPSTFNVDYLTHPVTVDVTSVGAWSISQCDEWIEPSVSGGPSGTTAVTLTIDDNTNSNAARTGTITFSNDITENTAVVTVNQGGAPTSIGLSPLRISGSKAGGEVRPVNYLSGHSWTMRSAPSWVAVSPTSGAAGPGTINVTYDTTNNTGAKRSGQLRIENTTTHEIAICIIEQEG